MPLTDVTHAETFHAVQRHQRAVQGVADARAALRSYAEQHPNLSESHEVRLNAQVLASAVGEALIELDTATAVLRVVGVAPESEVYRSLLA